MIMYRVLIADDDILMREALKIMITKEESFKVVQMAGSGESAVRACKEDAIDIVFMDMLMPGITGLEAGRIIHQLNPEITIYILSAYAANVLIRSAARDAIKDVLEKPITWDCLKKILENYKTDHEDSVSRQQEALTSVLRRKDFGEFYGGLSGIIDDIYEIAGGDSVRLIKVFTYLGQNLLDTRNVYDESRSIGELFPINEGLILDRKTSELWLFRIMDYLFQQNSISRYPLLENIFLYIEKHIKEDITLNNIIENCAISQGYLSRIFREQLKVSVTEYLHMKKMHLAKGYFYFTEDSIAEVAYRLGYNESSYFSKVFKKYEKMTVKQYKNETRRKSSP
ncbi:response regulator [Clostridium sp. Marseille-P2415]|uniref:response regulator n=1 Tax=Clostridium sp. Marseille-P2415 TaxID=1805471 RepID=UPI001F397F4C